MPIAMEVFRLSRAKIVPQITAEPSLLPWTKDYVLWRGISLLTYVDHNMFARIYKVDVSSIETKALD